MTEAVQVSLWAQRPFRMLNYTRFWSRVAQNCVNFALVLLIVRETELAFLSSLLVVALVIPATVAGMAAGTAADILPKRLLVVIGHLGRAAVCVLFVRGPGDVTSYYVVAIAFSAVGQFASAAEGALMPAIVPRPDLARANAIAQAIGGLAQVLGLGVLTPVLLRVFDSPDALFLLCAAMFVFAAVQAVLIGRVRSPRAEVGGEQQARTGPWWKTGWRAIQADTAVRHAVIELTLIATVLVVLGGLIPGYLESVLDLPVDVGALVLAPAVFGIALGLRIAGFLAVRVPHSVLSSTGFAVFVVLLLNITFVNEEADFLAGYGAFAWLADISLGNFDAGCALAMIYMFPLGFAYATVAVSGQTVINDLVPLHLQGRVNATQAALTAVLSAIPVIAAGALTDLVGVTPVLALLAVSTGVAAVLNLRPVSRPASHTARATP